MIIHTHNIPGTPSISSSSRCTLLLLLPPPLLLLDEEMPAADALIGSPSMLVVSLRGSPSISAAEAASADGDRGAPSTSSSPSS